MADVLSHSEPPDAEAVALVLEMTAPVDADGFQQPHPVAIKDVERALRTAQGDISEAVSEVLSLMAIKSLQLQDASTKKESPVQSQLQWHELCAGLGMTECEALLQALNSLPGEDPDEMVAQHGEFIQRLLLALDSENNSEDDNEDAQEEDHPLMILQALYPTYQMDVIERVFAQQNYDVAATADALQNLGALKHVHSYASVVSAQPTAAAMQRNLAENGPNVESLGYFPDLPAAGPSLNGIARGNQKARRRQQRFKPHLQIDNNVRGPKLRSVNAWDTQHEQFPTLGEDGREANIASKLKIERLQRLLPTIDRDVVQTTFFLNGCSSDAAEASLREIFNLPVAPKKPTHVEVEDVSEEVTNPIRISPVDECGYAQSRQRVGDSMQIVSERYCAVYQSFRSNRHNALAADRVRELSQARRNLRDAQRECAHEFFLAHQTHLRHQRAIDLHGLIVMESLQVAKEAVMFCRQERIRRCLLICGVGNHSVGGRPRILTAIQLSLERQQIDYRENHGMLTIFPLRSS